MGIEKIVKTAVGTAIGVGVVASLYFGVIKPINESARINREFSRTYQQALFKYADTNQDGLVSGAENDEFDRKLLHDKGVTLLPSEIPKYKDGTTVPTKVVTEWIRNYKPTE